MQRDAPDVRAVVGAPDRRRQGRAEGRVEGRRQGLSRGALARRAEAALVRAGRWLALRLAPDGLLALLGGGGDDRWTGAIGEELAARALARAGFVLLGRNVAAPEGELDLLARDGPALVVVEVKCGVAPATRDPEWRPADRVRVDAIAARLRAAGRIARRSGGAPRVDVVEVTLGGGAAVRVERFTGVGAARPFPWEEGRRPAMASTT